MAANIAWVALFFAGGADAPNPLQETLASAEGSLKKGDHRAALHQYRKVLFAVPGHQPALQREKEIIKILSTKHVEEGDRMWETNPVRAIELYRQAERLDSQGPVKAAFTRRGFKLHQGVWRTKEDIAAKKKTDAGWTEARIKKLGLPRGFRAVHLGVFRFFTDTDEKSSRFLQMKNAMQAHYEEYLRLMRPFSPVLPEEGLEIVLFQKEEDYRKHTESLETLGVYLPEKGASFFYVTKDAEDFATLLHEITHQLNHKVTGILGMPRSFEEGMAEYFSLGSLTNGGRKLTVGVPRGDRFTPVREAIRKDGLIPFQDLFTGRRLGENALLYPQSYALTYYLMESHPLGKLILYDVYTERRSFFERLREVRGGKVIEGREEDPEEQIELDEDDLEDGEALASALGKLLGAATSEVKPPRSVEEILSQYGLTPATLEEQFQGYCKALR